MKTSTLLTYALGLAALPSAGCPEARQDRAAPAAAPRAAPESVVHADQDDEEMNRAMRAAAASLDDFREALRGRPEGATRFEVKAKFHHGSAIEHMWLTSVRETGDGFSGTLINEPYRLDGYRVGQQLTVPASAVSDWAYVQEGLLVGGFTLRVMFERTPPAQREMLQHRLGYRFEAARAAPPQGD